jgi:glycosyltransferase involved in cell wall biosynthesis
VPQKGFDLLIDALSKIKGSMSPWKLRIYGEGPDRETLETQIREKGLSGIVEIHSPTRALHDRYLESEIFVLSSRFEGFSLVLAEAMSRGLACVAFDCDLGPGELIENGKTGLLVEAENSDSLARAIQDLMRDKTLRDNLGSAALETSKRFEPEAIKELWLKLFSVVLTKSRT